MESCREAFKNIIIFTIIALYIKEVILYGDVEDLERNKDIHQHNTRHANFYNLPTQHLSKYEMKPSYGRRKLSTICNQSFYNRQTFEDSSEILACDPSFLLLGRVSTGQTD